MFQFPPTGMAVESQNLFAKNWMKCQNLHRKIIIGNFQSKGVGLNFQNIFFQRIEWNVQIYLETHICKPQPNVKLQIVCFSLERYQLWFPAGSPSISRAVIRKALVTIYVWLLVF